MHTVACVQRPRFKLPLLLGHPSVPLITPFIRAAPVDPYVVASRRYREEGIPQMAVAPARLLERPQADVSFE